MAGFGGDGPHEGLRATQTKRRPTQAPCRYRTVTPFFASVPATMSELDLVTDIIATGFSKRPITVRACRRG